MDDVGQCILLQNATQNATYYGLLEGDLFAEFGTFLEWTHPVSELHARAES
jgi:hypothetical protein